ncbi:hypothetical protein DYB32_004988 [Aphanomyces invadans]|uniref:Uncharacterized protein n=1 Tax=Aphanomyces invadans TaxID=157072 RepID=A0A418AVY2_9STRA|nr:hypothetical protein DYB32_004988 [Aphanomyces invadans]
MPAEPDNVSGCMSRMQVKLDYDLDTTSMPPSAVDEELKAEAEERVKLRRTELKKLCVVRDLRSTDKIEKCFQKAHQIYRQCQLYVIEKDYDHALFQKKMPGHREFRVARFEKDRKLLEKKCYDALALLDRILDGMFHEELEHLQHAHDEEEHIMAMHPDAEFPSAPAKDAVASALEGRLMALKGKPAPVAQSVACQDRDNAFEVLRMAPTHPSRTVSHDAHHLHHFSPTQISTRTFHAPPVSYPSLATARPSWLTTVGNGQTRRSSIQSKALRMR